MKRFGILVATLVACVVLVSGSAVSETLKSASGPTDEVKAGSLQVAARSSKPKEIVVVGSKVKDVIRSAGLRSDAAFDQALNAKAEEMLREAFSRARANGRTELRANDLSCRCGARRSPTRAGSDNTAVKERIEAAGFTANSAFLSAVTGQIRHIVETAVERAKSNGRGTVRPYDL